MNGELSYIDQKLVQNKRIQGLTKNTQTDRGQTEISGAWSWDNRKNKRWEDIDGVVPSTKTKAHGNITHFRQIWKHVLCSMRGNTCTVEPGAGTLNTLTPVKYLEGSSGKEEIEALAFCSFSLLLFNPYYSTFNSAIHHWMNAWFL